MSPTSDPDDRARSADPPVVEEPIVVDEDGIEHPDPITRREGLEQELVEEGRSEAGAEVGQHIK